MPAPEIEFQNYSTVQGPLQPKPQTIASATTIVPTSFLTVLTGNTVIATITPPMPNVHMIALQFAGVAGVNAAGNVSHVKATVALEILLLVYNPLDAKYHPVG